jgi:hypothetical protein
LAALATLTPKSAAVAEHVRPFKTEEATRARRSSEYGRVMHAGLLTSLHLESHYISSRNPDSVRYKRALKKNPRVERGTYCFFVKKQQKTFFTLGLGRFAANATRR